MRRFRYHWLACLIVVATVLLDGCNVSYHLQGQGPTAILVPPVRPAVLTGDPSVSRIRVSNARSHPAILNGCDIQNDLLTLQWLGNTAEIRIKAESYFPAPGDERPEEVGPRVFLDAAQRQEAFLDALDDREAKGCLRSDEVQRIRRAIAERFSLPSVISQSIRFGGGPGFIDLTADFRLRVAGPLRSTDGLREVVGYQINYYALTPEPKSARIRISLSSVPGHQTQEHQEDHRSPSTQVIDFPASFRFFRLLFRSAASSADHIATILGASDKGALNEAMRRFEMALDCKVLRMPDVTCVTPASDVSVNLEFAVLVNGKQVFIPLGGTLSDAIRPRNPSSEILRTLRIRRLFHGHLRTIKFDPASQGMLRFVLMPGDKITW